MGVVPAHQEDHSCFFFENQAWLDAAGERSINRYAPRNDLPMKTYGGVDRYLRYPVSNFQR